MTDITSITLIDALRRLLGERSEDALASALSTVCENFGIDEFEIVRRLMPRAAQRHETIVRSRREWIDAATSVLGPDWDGTADDLRTALLEEISKPQAEIDRLREESAALRAAAERREIVERRPSAGDIYEHEGVQCTIVETREERVTNDAGVRVFATAIYRRADQFGLELVAALHDIEPPEWVLVSRAKR
jgi:hypothetical protein